MRIKSRTNIAIMLPRVWMILPLLALPLFATDENAPHKRAANLLRENPPRQAEALEMLEEAARAGDRRGDELRAYLYLEGPEKTRRPEESARIYQQAAADGSQAARHNLALLQLDGRGIARDTAAAFAALETNAASGFLTSIVKIAEIHYFGHNEIPRDYAKALTHLRAAAALQSAWAENMLGAVYQNGHGVAACRATAIDWYERAAKRGHVRAMSNLGFLLRSGPPECHDIPGAIMWLTLAAEGGDAAARNMLEDVGARFDPQAQEEGRRRIEAFRQQFQCVTDPSRLK